MEQEISFRLSLRTAQFLGNSPETGEKYIKIVTNSITLRSRIVHGVWFIKHNAEGASRYLVQDMLPIVERLAGRCLRKIFELSLQIALDELLLGESLESVLEKQGCLPT